MQQLQSLNFDNHIQFLDESLKYIHRLKEFNKYFCLYLWHWLKVIVIWPDRLKYLISNFRTDFAVDLSFAVFLLLIDPIQEGFFSFFSFELLPEVNELVKYHHSRC